MGTKTVKAYAFAALSISVALFLTLFIAPVQHKSPYLLLALGVMVSANRGLGPGVFATLLGAVLGAYFIIPPEDSFVLSGPEDLVPLLLFCCVGLAITWISHRLQLSRDRILAANQMLAEAQRQSKEEKEHIARLYDAARKEIARRERVEMELRRSNADLEQFAFAISHDLRSPLNAVSSFANQLFEEYRDKLGEDADKYINYILGASARMRRLIADLLVYSRVATAEAGKLEVADCEEALLAAELNLQEKIREAGAAVTHDPLPKVVTGAGLLIQVFQNLLENSIKFRGDASPLIHVSAEQQREDWLFSISDNGIGIEPQHLEQVFRIFRRLHGDAYEGTGIGLAVCKKIVERQGGRIWADSVKGQGARFCFTVPAGPQGMSEAAGV